MFKTKFGVSPEVLEFFGEKNGRKKKKKSRQSYNGRFARPLIIILKTWQKSWETIRSDRPVAVLNGLAFT